MMTATVLAGPERRRRWTTTEKLRMVEESLTAGLSVAEFARAEVELPGLRDDCAGAAAVVSDRARPARSRSARPCRGLEIRRWAAALSAERHLCAARHRHRPF